MKILLFDMDDVLVKPGGYHRALQETLRLLSLELGLGEFHLTHRDILAFESAGVYSEWDTAAMCAVLLLEQVWQVDGEFTLPTRSKAPLKPQPAYGLRAASDSRPNLRAFAAALAAPELQSLPPLQRAERVFLNGDCPRPAHQAEHIRHILRSARAADGSWTHQTFQELILGSQIYAQIYPYPPRLNCESYLLKYDRSLLPKEMLARLRLWLNRPDQRAAIFTSRPSNPLPGVFSTPEAELGARLAGVEGLPILGLGSLLWLTQLRQAGAQAFVKPSPVHALAAVLLAWGRPTEESLQASAALALDGQVFPIWKELNEAQVWVFEDSPAGIRSAVEAQRLLTAAGVKLRFELIGIARERLKAQSLQRLGARPFASLGEALRAIEV